MGLQLCEVGTCLGVKVFVLVRLVIQAWTQCKGVSAQADLWLCPQSQGHCLVSPHAHRRSKLKDCHSDVTNSMSDPVDEFAGQTFAATTLRLSKTPSTLASVGWAAAPACNGSHRPATHAQVETQSG
eukprot:2310626-Amphidinium_carterae.2